MSTASQLQGKKCDPWGRHTVKKRRAHKEAMQMLWSIVPGASVSDSYLSGEVSNPPDAPGSQLSSHSRPFEIS